MKILQIHNRYQIAGGEDVVVASEQKLLAAHHDVLSYTVSNDGIRGIRGKLDTALHTHYSKRQKQALGRYLAEHKPDVAHVHNFFPVLTPAIYDACIEAGVPVVQTLHNYRTLCANALLMRDGRICERCVKGSPYWGAYYGCYRDSRLGSLVVAHSVAYHRRQATWQTKVDRFIALTEFGRQKFVSAGFPANKISVKPNFAEEPLEDGFKPLPRQPFALFVGRLSEEKGLGTLLQAWESVDFALKIVGGGELPATAPANVRFLGKQTKAQVYGLMQQAQFLVMPSEWYETFGLVLIEAFANGLPVICSRLGGMAEIVEDNVTGLHFEAGNADDLAAKIHWALVNPEAMAHMGQAARAEYEAKYTPEINYRQLMAIYQAAIDTKFNTMNALQARITLTRVSDADD
jgi:glycosyltransferase involved in cell wall biosynthesis